MKCIYVAHLGSVLQRSIFHATRIELLMYVVGQGIEEAMKSRLTAWNIKVYEGAHSCLRHVALLLQINTACLSRIYFDFILSHIPNLPLFSLSLKFLISIIFN